MVPEFFVRLEDAALNAWPAPRQMVYDGWLLRFAGGYTKRVNSVNIRFESRLPIPEKIRVCENIYAHEGLPLIFRLPDPFVSAQLLNDLDQTGYQIFDPTFVLGRKISHCGEFFEGVHTHELNIREWIELRAELTGTRLDHWDIHQQILEIIVPEKVLLGLYLNNKPVACGMAVLADDLLGYFSIFVDEKYRRNRCGEMTMWGLTNWGVTRGANFGYLQVEGDNHPALRLYEKMGFETCYRYVYSKRLGEEG